MSGEIDLILPAPPSTTVNACMHAVQKPHVYAANLNSLQIAAWL